MELRPSFLSEELRYAIPVNKGQAKSLLLELLTREHRLDALLPAIMMRIEGKPLNFSADFGTLSLERIKGQISQVLAGMQKGEDEAISTKGELIKPCITTQVPERLGELLEAYIGQMKEDFDRGIVVMTRGGRPEGYDSGYYPAALREDKTAGQVWEGEYGLEARLREYLLANDAAKLKLAAALPGGPCLAGVYEDDGEPAIRQRDLDITNVIVTPEGQFVLLPHADAMRRVAADPREKWATAKEIIEAVQASNFRVLELRPGDFSFQVDASQVVMGCNYVQSPVTDYPAQREWRCVIFKDPEATSGSRWAPAVGFSPDHNYVFSIYIFPDTRNAGYGMILWL
ncbi:hypothetical protein IPG41_02935 [Candidatus Peregrinibacteria bacterium]|nr:MAG: hypothetical protein IPG41_02935 [Candidatus Peregrinibacteria bacterium]